MLDEDDTVKDLAVKSIEEIWFPSTSPPPATKSRSSIHASNLGDRNPLLSKVVVIMGTSANFKDRQSPLEDVLHKIMADKEGGEAPSLHARYTEICETLIDGLVDASDLPGFVSPTTFFCNVADTFRLSSIVSELYICSRRLILQSCRVLMHLRSCHI